MSSAGLAREPSVFFPSKFSGIGTEKSIAFSLRSWKCHRHCIFERRYLSSALQQVPCPLLCQSSSCWNGREEEELIRSALLGWAIRSTWWKGPFWNVSRYLQPAVILVYCNTDFFGVLIHTGWADQGRAVRSWARGWDPLGALRVSEGPSTAPLPPLPGAGSSGMWRSLPAAQCRERAPACSSQGSPQLSGAAWSQSSCPLSAIWSWASFLERTLPRVSKCLKKSLRLG